MRSLNDFLALFRLAKSYWLLLHLFFSATFSISTSIHCHGPGITCRFLGHFFFKLVTKLARCHQILPQRFEWMTICCKLRPVTFFVRPMIVSIYLSKMCHGWRKYWHTCTCTPISFERFDKLRGEMAICNGEIGPHSNQREVLYLSARQKIHYGQVNDITK